MTEMERAHKLCENNTGSEIINELDNLAKCLQNCQEENEEQKRKKACITVLEHNMVSVYFFYSIHEYVNVCIYIHLVY